ncbi:MAG: hypothetical protein JWN50_707 [Parcubacteria group bacterium]|nr:hypothetical protein [Parcubacteria group bacterium]
MEDYVSGGLFAPKSILHAVAPSQKEFRSEDAFKEMPVYITQTFHRLYIGKIESASLGETLEISTVARASNVVEAYNAFGPRACTTLYQFHYILSEQIRIGIKALSASLDCTNVFFIKGRDGKVHPACIKCLGSGHWKVYANHLIPEAPLGKGDQIFSLT